MATGEGAGAAGAVGTTVGATTRTIYAAMLAQHNVTEEELAAMAAAAESGAALRLEENVWRRNSGQMTSPRALHHPGPLPAETAPIRRPSSAYLDDLLEA